MDDYEKGLTEAIEASQLAVQMFQREQNDCAAIRCKGNLEAFQASLDSYRNFIGSYKGSQDGKTQTDY